MSHFIFDFSEDSFIARVWFVGADLKGGLTGDMLAILFKQHVVDAMWIARVRTRIHNPDPANDLFKNDIDRKTTEAFTAPDSEKADSSDAIDAMAIRLAILSGGELDIVDIDGDDKMMHEKLKDMPWFFSKPMSECQQ